MSSTQLKQHLHQYIDEADQRFLNMIYAMMKEYDINSISLNVEEKKAIDKGLDSIEKGNIIAHDQVISSLKKKYPNLKMR